MKKVYYIIALLCLLVANNSFSQKNTHYSRKGQAFVFWGYNRGTYAKSDITFTGKGYDFTLHNVVAEDYASPFTFDRYFNPNTITIPQFNFRGGYFFNDHWCVMIGWDHMKYVMVNDQKASISGHISAQVSEPVINVNPQYVGDYNHTPFTINSKDFLVFEHTDGFNYASVELDRYDRLWKAKNNIQGIDWLVGVGAGPVVPRTDAHLFTVGQNHRWNIAGWGVSLKTGLRFDISRRLFFQADIKGGYSYLSNIRSTGHASDVAKQSIWFGEFYGALGYTIKKGK
jgi:hypothetical protein